MTTLESIRPVDRVTMSAVNNVQHEEVEQGRSKNEQKRLLRRRLRAESNPATTNWALMKQQFVAMLLDASYLAHPIRSSTMLAAQSYPPGRVGSAQETTATSRTLLPGNHKHLGGAFDAATGSIFGVPAHAGSILCLHVNDDNYEMTSIPLPPHVATVPFKWLRGFVVLDCLWAIPSWGPAVLCVDMARYYQWRQLEKTSTVPDSLVQLIPLPPEHPRDMTWQWHGAGLNHEKTAAYCIPSNAAHVLKVDLVHQTTSLIRIDASNYPQYQSNMPNKWYGGITGADNCVYGIPYRSCAVLRIDCATDTAALVGPDYGCSQFNWHGGILVNGCIYAHPSHANSVLVIDTNPKTGPAAASDQTGTVSTDNYCTELPIHGSDVDCTPHYKWLGGIVGADGTTIYCPPCDTAAILKIDTVTNTCTTFGDCTRAKNKWQGGVYSPRDECVYCIPASGTHVLRIATGAAAAADDYELLGPLPNHRDKWQGGHVGRDGCLYFIPENGYRVLKITPPLQPPTSSLGEESSDQVVMEFL
jgi:hypothetical protein